MTLKAIFLTCCIHITCSLIQLLMHTHIMCYGMDSLFT